MFFIDETGHEARLSAIQCNIAAHECECSGPRGYRANSGQKWLPKPTVTTSNQIAITVIAGTATRICSHMP
jgi:hypothetical protein